MRQARDDEIHLEGQKCEQLNCFASAKQFDVMLLQAEREEVSVKTEQDVAIDLTYKDSAWSKSPVIDDHSASKSSILFSKFQEQYSFQHFIFLSRNSPFAIQTEEASWSFVRRTEFKRQQAFKQQREHDNHLDRNFTIIKSLQIRL